MQHFDRLKQEGAQAHAFRTLRRDGFSASQTWEILREDEPLAEIEARLMREQHWSLHQVRQVLHDALLLGLLTAPPDYRTKLNAYLEQHGAFIAEDEPATDS
jgi:hypothetical protein